MDQVDSNSTRHKGLWAGLAIAALTGASVITIALPAVSSADPQPTPTPVTAAPPPAAGSANPPEVRAGEPLALPLPADSNTPPPPVTDPGAPQPGRINNAAGGFSFVVPAGWVESDASRLDYGSALLSRVTGEPPLPGQPAPVANDTRIVLGRLDQKLYASAETTNLSAAARLGSDMGEFFMPYPGTRINQEAVPLDANGVTGSASYYEVKFSDAAKPDGQIWTGVIGSPTTDTPDAGPPERWFAVWLGTGNDPVDKNAAKVLAESIRSLTSPVSVPAPAAAPAPGAPAPVPEATAPVSAPEASASAAGEIALAPAAVPPAPSA